MSAPDRSWTIAPVLLWFSVALIAGLWTLDGGVQALADRLTARREPRGSGRGALSFAPAPVAVAEADPDPAPGAAVGAGAGAAAGDPGRVGAAGGLEDVCLEGTPQACKRWAMDGFYRALADARRAALGRALRVSWYGDSVIAGDTIPARLRARLQREPGDGGPGFVFVAPPHRFCLHEAISRSGNEAEWRSYAISTVNHPDGLYGVGGATAETYGANTTLKVLSGKVSRVGLDYLAQKPGGTIRVLADGAEVLRVDTKADQKTPSRVSAAVPGGASKFKLEVDRGRTRVFGVTLENATGAVVDNLGIVSANVNNFSHRDAAHFTAELGHRGADLILLMLGANEARWLSPRDQDTKLYQGRFERALEPLRKGRPTASCIVVSPTDQAEVTDGSYRSRPVMPVLVDAQRRAAHAQGCAFYSTYDWMGGKGSALRWNRVGLLGGDFTHLSIKGGNKLADAVYDALIAGARRYGRP